MKYWFIFARGIEKVKPLGKSEYPCLAFFSISEEWIKRILGKILRGKAVQKVSRVNSLTIPNKKNPSQKSPKSEIRSIIPTLDGQEIKAPHHTKMEVISWQTHTWNLFTTVLIGLKRLCLKQTSKRSQDWKIAASVFKELMQSRGVLNWLQMCH